jgi:drug/metabolite transporter (DMT)-like permease
VTSGVLLVVLVGALLHASCNLLLKSSSGTRLGTGWVWVGGGLLAALALPFVPVPARASWPYLGASTVVEALYAALLGATYRAGDLGHAYPLMRGTAPLLVALGSGLFLGERLTLGLWTGVALISLGVLSLVFDARARGHSMRATRLALLTAVMIAVYTTSDGRGVRAAGSALSYSLWLFMLVGVPWLLWMLPKLRTLSRPELRPALLALTVGGACSLGSYGLALWAMTQAPVAAVAAVRETAIVFGMMLGVWFLHERVSYKRVLAVLAIVLGVCAIRVL